MIKRKHVERTECDFRFLNCCFAIGQARLRSARPVITAVTFSFLNLSDMTGEASAKFFEMSEMQFLIPRSVAGEQNILTQRAISIILYSTL